MLDSLRFVQGAVAKKDFVPALTHFKIQGGFIRGFNGMLGLSCPIDIDLDVNPKALQFVKAIQACKDTIQLHMTPSGKLSIKSGKFKVLVDCHQDSFPEVHPEGEEVPLNGNLLDTLKTLFPFIAEDASRPWARGILFRGQSAYATNNITLVERWLGTPFPVEINIPKTAVAELLRIGEEPTRLLMTENSATFCFDGERWLRTQTYSTDWPDLQRILDSASSQEPLPPGLIDAIEALSPFVDDLGRIYLSDGLVATGGHGSTEASLEVDGLHGTGCYNYQQLLLLKGVAVTADFTSHPKPSLFYGDKIRGAAIGIRS
jgi:DNA polymerase III sliding clamp (beta) subunit (PCNA family)